MPSLRAALVAAALVPVLAACGDSHEREASLSELASHATFALDARRDAMTIDVKLDASLLHTPGQDDHPCLSFSPDLVVKLDGRRLDAATDGDGAVSAESEGVRLQHDWGDDDDRERRAERKRKREEKERSYTCSPLRVRVNVRVATVAPGAVLTLEQGGAVVRLPVGAGLAGADAKLVGDGTTRADERVKIAVDGAVEIFGATGQLRVNGAAPIDLTLAASGAEVSFVTPSGATGDALLTLDRLDLERRSAGCGAASACTVRAIVAAKTELPLVVR
jgi:hypothetical protein